MRAYLDNCCYNRPFKLDSVGGMRVASPVEFIEEVEA